MLKIKNLKKIFNNNIILNDITLDIDEKQIIGLAGPSGGGKSTLLRCIQGFEKYDAGSISFNCKTGFMFQDFQLFPHMTVLENLTYAKKLTSNTQQTNIEAEKLLTQLNIENKTGNYPAELSGGQKQRVALARSLMMNPDILLCDEPTSGLDVATIYDVVNLLKKVQSMGVSMIIASHDLDFLSQISDRIILLKNGHIAEDLQVKNAQYNIVDILKKWY
jgi:polar amino acid transport system ATP-binding protein